MTQIDALGEDERELEGEEAEEAARRALLEGRRLRVIRDVDERYVFRFEFGPAILAQVREKLDALPGLPLADVTRETAKYPGFYQLFRGGRSVYVGRTIRPIGQRLEEHRGRLRGRVPLAEMRARFLFVEDLSLVALSEDTMIAYFQPLALDEWGTMGFGSKAPGYGRAGQASEWDAAYPPDLDYPVVAGVEGRRRSMNDLVKSIGKGSPIRLSLPRGYSGRFNAAHPGLVDAPIAERPFREWITQLEGMLAPGWRIRREPMAWYIVED